MFILDIFRYINYIVNKILIKLLKLFGANTNVSRKSKKTPRADFAYSEQEIVDWLKKQGIGKGDTIFVHSSWDNFLNFTGTPRGLIQSLLELVGPNGTIAMPAFPQNQDPGHVFNVKRTPSGAGYLTEMFRRMKGVKRSINLNHSVCAYGYYADYLVKDHHKCSTSWDENSPYYKLKYINAWIIGLGVGHNLEITTSLHCVDSILSRELVYFNQLFPYQITYQFIDTNKQQGKHTFYKRVGGPLCTKKVAQYMDKSKLKEGYVQDLSIYAIPADYLIDRAIELGREGVTMYVYPIPWPWKFRAL